MELTLVPQEDDQSQILKGTDMLGRSHCGMWIGLGAAYYIGNIKSSDFHCHHAIQIAIAKGGTLDVSDDNTPSRQVSGIIVPSQKRHRVFQFDATETLLIYLEPDSGLGRTIATRCSPGDGPMVEIDAICTQKILQLLHDPKISNHVLIESTVSLLVGEALEEKRLDTRVSFALQYINNHLSALDSLECIATVLSITPRYLRRLFEREIGMSMQRYRLWCKLRKALFLAASGTSLTEAAIEACFADSAHLSRTFRDIFGAAPSRIFSG